MAVVAFAQPQILGPDLLGTTGCFDLRRRCVPESMEDNKPWRFDTSFDITAGARDRRLAHQEAARQSQRTRAEPHPSQNLAVQRVMAQSGGQVCS